MLEYTYFEQKNNPHFFPNLWPTDQTLALPGGQPARLGRGGGPDRAQRPGGNLLEWEKGSVEKDCEPRAIFIKTIIDYGFNI